MALIITDADAYIGANCIDIEDWTDADDAKKQRIINVANRTLTGKFPDKTIPEAAVFEFANVLATVFNDTNRMMQQGVSSVRIDGAVSFDFKDSAVFLPGTDISQYIPKSALDAIGVENGGGTVSKRRVGWTVL